MHTALRVPSVLIQRAMWCLLAMCALAAWSPAPAATTYYVRTDGGDEEQCNGRADAAYPGSGSDIDCAWKSPYYALPTNDKPRIKGGDTLIIGQGEYMMGWGSPGLSRNSVRCYPAAPYDCYPAAPPSGPSPEQRTRILGQGYDTGCKVPPKLWGTQRAQLVLNLEDTENVEVGCLEITDRSDCVEFHVDESLRCQRDREPLGDWASIGIGAKRSSNVWLHDLNIHGLAGRGVMAGGLRDWTVERVRIIANGWAGWDGDVGEGESSNEGNIIFRNVEIAWNGCAERWATGEPFACWAQEEGGYGDGLGTGKSDGHWVIEDSRIHHNTSDGLDLLYLDESKTSTIVIRRLYAAANAGNQIKTAGNALIENSVIIGQCAYFHDKFNMTDGDMCRAMGNALSVGVGKKHTAIIRHNTITGEGDCLILTAGGDKSSQVLVQNNALIGHRDVTSGDPQQSCGHYADQSEAVVKFSDNLFWNVKDDQCFAGNVCGKDPKLTKMDMGDFDAVPLAGSPLIDRAENLGEVTSDFLHHARPVGSASDIGAIEVQGKGAAAAPAASDNGQDRSTGNTGTGGSAAPAATPAAASPTTSDATSPPVTQRASPGRTIGTLFAASLLTAGIVTATRRQRMRSQVGEG